MNGFDNGLKAALVLEVKLHPAAEAEFEEAIGWYIERSKDAAARFENAFAEAIELLLTQPKMFPKCDEVHRYILLTRFPYSLIYRIDDDSALILAVAHSKRQTKYWSERV